MKDNSKTRKVLSDLDKVRAELSRFVKRGYLSVSTDMGLFYEDCLRKRVASLKGQLSKLPHVLNKKESKLARQKAAKGK